MKQLVKDVASAGCKNSCGLLGTGNNNNIIIIVVILLLCGCGGAGEMLGSLGRRRGRRRSSGRSLLWLIILAFILSGNNSTGRNANTNIINVDPTVLEGSEPGLLDL